jgi:1,4-dihydroxy-2-naphthoate octaprenyltransferase
MSDKTDFLNALRPFSLIVALATCGLGISLAMRDGFHHPTLAALVIITGLLLQAGVNLINDHRDLIERRLPFSRQRAIRRNTRIGWLAIILATLVGFYFVSIRGWPLLLLGLLGVLGAWGYTGGKINYKARGLGIPLVFLLMGLLLVGGAYYTISGTYHWHVLWLSVPFSLLSALLLLSNELRDYEQDRAAGIQTLTVRLGYNSGVKLYFTLVISLYLFSALLYLADLLPGLLYLVLSAPALIAPLKLLRKPWPERTRLTPLTGRHYAIYSGIFLATIWFSLP